MEVTCFTVGMFQVNTYLLKDTASGHCAIVDTGETDELVKHLQAMTPPPDIKIFLPTLFAFSNTSTRLPCLATVAAHMRPEAPAPIMITS